MSDFDVTDSDREFAAQILEDFSNFEEGIENQENLAEWIRNVRKDAVKRCEVRTDELLAELRHHERDYPELVHGPLCGKAADEIERRRTAAQAPLPFLCPCCGARGTTDGKASTVASASSPAQAQLVPADLQFAVRGLNEALDDYWNTRRTDEGVKLICYWQFKCREALSASSVPSASRGTEA